MGAVRLWEVDLDCPVRMDMGGIRALGVVAVSYRVVVAVARVRVGVVPLPFLRIRALHLRPFHTFRPPCPLLPGDRALRRKRSVRSLGTLEAGQNEVRFPFLRTR
jgi:hypothetical protein